MDLVHVKRMFLGAVIFNRPILDGSYVGDNCGRQTGVENFGCLSGDREVVVSGAVGTFCCFGKIKASRGRGLLTGQTSKALHSDGRNLSRGNVVLRGNAKLAFLSI